jgi:multidrug resistance efflux pump
VPVRIAIDDNPGRPMIAGLSAHVKVDTKEAPLPSPQQQAARR